MLGLGMDDEVAGSPLGIIRANQIGCFEVSRSGAKRVHSTWINEAPCMLESWKCPEEFETKSLAIRVTLHQEEQSMGITKQKKKREGLVLDYGLRNGQEESG